ncbi:MAG: hypothetical protein ACJ8AH_22360, partial [Stellaceae bacterium]
EEPVGRSSIGEITSMAALRLTLRAIQHYEVGTRGIPRVTELACWAREQGAEPRIFQSRPTPSL